MVIQPGRPPSSLRPGRSPEDWAITSGRFRNATRLFEQELRGFSGLFIGLIKVLQFVSTDQPLYMTPTSHCRTSRKRDGEYAWLRSRATLTISSTARGLSHRIMLIGPIALANLRMISALSLQKPEPNLRYATEAQAFLTGDSPDTNSCCRKPRHSL